MEAFKAANPKGCLGDFVRWHSPRDWIENDNNNEADFQQNGNEIKETGKLSKRMDNPNSLWWELWNQAKPIPANLQRPLFDCKKEGEKVNHSLEFEVMF